MKCQPKWEILLPLPASESAGAMDNRIFAGFCSLQVYRWAVPDWKLVDKCVVYAYCMYLSSRACMRFNKNPVFWMHLYISCMHSYVLWSATVPIPISNSIDIVWMSHIFSTDMRSAWCGQKNERVHPALSYIRLLQWINSKQILPLLQFSRSRNISMGLAIFLLRLSPFGGARKGAPSRPTPSKLNHSSRDVEHMDFFANCVFSPHILGPLAFLFSTTAAPGIWSSTADKLQPDNRFGLLQVFAIAAFVCSILPLRGNDRDGGKAPILSAGNTAMHESSATCAAQQRSHPMINLRPHQNATVPGRNSQSFSFEEAAYITTNPERADGKAQSRGGDAYTILNVIFDSLFFWVSASFEQCLFMQDRKWPWLEKKRNKQVITDTRWTPLCD